MAYKTLIFGMKDTFLKKNIYEMLKPFYDAQVKCGNLEIVATAELEGDEVNLVYADGRQGGVEDISNFDLVILSSRNQLYHKMKFIEAQGVPRNRIIDGYVFKVPNLDFPRFLKEGVVYGVFDNKTSFFDNTSMIYPRVYKFKNSSVSTINLGVKSRINTGYGCPARIEQSGIITFGNFSAMAWGGFFQLGLNDSHNPKILTSYHPNNLDWALPRDFNVPSGVCKINIGNDVWIGRGCILKCNNPNKPLVIGDGAVVASDSVVVKEVPPYAIVGGNPAKIIKYRFPPHVIKALLRIKWWDWSLDKIHDNFKYFNDVEKFVSIHDEQFNRLKETNDDFDYINSAKSFISPNYNSDAFELKDLNTVI